jgi:hypothetical protein
VATHTSPEDLLTDQTPSSAASALELATRNSVIATTWRIPVVIPVVESIGVLGLPAVELRISGNVSTSA